MLACFGLDAANDSFAVLSTQNPIVFRIHQGCKTQPFTAKRFRQQPDAPIPTEKEISQAQIIEHIIAWTPSDSPWISCTFSLPYVLWESHRRLKTCPELSTTLFVSFVHVTHPSLENRTILAVEGLRGPVSRSSKKSTQKAINFARAFQEVLVYGEVPPQAVIATLPWGEFASAFQSTHLNIFDVDCWPTSFEYFCRRLRSELNTINITAAMAISVNQAFELLGSTLYANAQTSEDLGRATELIYEMSHALFAWPYRHMTYLDVSYQYESEGRFSLNADDTFKQGRLVDIIKTHQIHRRASLTVRLISLGQQILDSTPARGISASSSKGQMTESILSEHMTNSRMKLLREALVDTIADIDALEMVTASAACDEDADEILCERQAKEVFRALSDLLTARVTVYNVCEWTRNLFS